MMKTAEVRYNSRKNIVVYTSSFPYGRGEQFFIPELHYILKYFDKVTIQPYYYGKFREKRIIDSRVIVRKPLLGSFSPLRMITQAPRVICALSLLWKDLWTHKSELVCASFKWWMRQAWEMVLATINNDFNVDGVIYFYWGMGATCLVPLFKHHPNVTIVCKFHGSDLYEDGHPGWIPLRLPILDATDMAIAISIKGKAYLDAYGHKPAACYRMGISNNYILGSYIRPVIFTVVSCSAVIPLKRVNLIARAIMGLDFPVQWHHFGDGSEFMALKMLVEKENRGSANIVLHGAVSNDYLMEFYSSHIMDAFINFSTTEGIPVSIMEAISFGIPVIATDVGGNSEITVPSCGILLPMDASVEDLRLALSRLQMEPTKMRIERRRAARSCWEEQYNADRNFPALMKNILSLMELHPSEH